MSDAVGQLLTGVLSDEILKKRMVALLAETENAERAKEELRVQTEAHQQALADIQRERREIDTARGDLKMREDALAAETANLAKAIGTFNGERDAWVAQRIRVDGEQADREARIADTERAQTAVAERQAAKETELNDRETAIAETEDRHAAAVRHADAFTQAVTAR